MLSDCNQNATRIVVYLTTVQRFRGSLYLTGR